MLFAMLYLHAFADATPAMRAAAFSCLYTRLAFQRHAAERRRYDAAADFAEATPRSEVCRAADAVLCRRRLPLCRAASPSSATPRRCRLLYMFDIACARHLLATAQRLIF